MVESFAPPPPRKKKKLTREKIGVEGSCLAEIYTWSAFLVFNCISSVLIVSVLYLIVSVLYLIISSVFNCISSVRHVQALKVHSETE